MAVGRASVSMRSTMGHNTVLGEGVAGEVHGWARTFAKLKSLLQPSSSFGRRRGDFENETTGSASIVLEVHGWGTFDVATELRGLYIWARRRYWTRGNNG